MAKRRKITADDLQIETLGTNVKTLDKKRDTAKDGIKSVREKKRQIAGWFDPIVQLQMNQLALDLGVKKGSKVTIQSLLTEALNDLFKKHKKPPIA